MRPSPFPAIGSQGGLAERRLGADWRYAAHRAALARRQPGFASRYDAVLAQRVEILEDLATRRALGTDRRPIFHRGKQVATVDRHNDIMLMGVLARFDRLRERRERSAAPSDRFADAKACIRALDEAGKRAKRQARQQLEEDARSENVVVQATR